MTAPRLVLSAVLFSLLAMTFAQYNFHYDHAIARLPWESKEAATRMAHNHLPIVWTGAPVSEWPAMEDWTPQYFSQFANKMVGAKILRHKKFSPGCCAVNNITMKEFVSRAIDETRGEYMYLSTPVSTLGGQIALDAQPVDFLLVGNPPKSEVKSYFWMGSRGATTQLHHDYLHNYFVQVHGRKRFMIFPAVQWSNLYLYPRYHFKHRQLQVDIDQPSYTLYPSFRNVTGIEVVLSPGEVLYLPPLWFHQVDAIDMSISINLWSPYSDLTDMDKAWEEALPIKPKAWTKDRVIATSAAFLQAVVEIVSHDKNSARAFMQKLDRRYTVLAAMEKDGPPMEDHHDHDHNHGHDHDHDHGHEHAGQTSHGRGEMGVAAAASSTLPAGVNPADPDVAVYQNYRKNLAAADPFVKKATAESIAAACEDLIHDELLDSDARLSARRAATAFMDTLDTGVREIYLGHYVEDLAAQVVGEANILPFIQHCLVH